MIASVTLVLTKSRDK